jgi:LPXTG-site transpeptidase (sortase) family protein
MRSKILSRRTLLIVVLAEFVFFAALLFYFIQQSSNLLVDRQVQNSLAPFTANITTLYEQEKVNSGLPMYLKIPRINIDTALEFVGLTYQGAVDVPKDPINAAWFNLGPRPGDNGSAIITGHYGIWKNGKRSVFNNLYKLRKGDKLYIEDDKGVIISFVVRESRRYDSNADASDVFVSSDGKAHLNLITCEGVWNRVSKSYSERLVVFTDKE